MIARPARLLVPALLTLVGIVAGACTESVPPVALASLRISPQLDSFFVGKVTAANPFSVTLFDANSVEIKDGRPITYTSTAPTVFTVDSKTGIITGVTLGSGFLRASSSGRFIEAGVKIIAPVDRIQLNTGDFSIAIGGTRQLAPNLTAADGSSISNRVITYISSNPNVATVSTGGLVTAVAEGTSTITASAEGKSSAVIATVLREAVASVRLAPQVAQLLRVGGQLQVTATPLNGANQALTGRTVNWSTNNPSVVTVTQQGVVSAIAVGNATITAESETRTASLGITVTEVPPRSVTLEPDSFALGNNLTRQLTPIVIDSAGRLVTSLNNRQVIWQSTSSIVATVGTTGVVTGQGAGTARISVTVDGLRSNDVVVVVSPQVATVRITPFNPQLLRIGTTVQLTATALDASNQPIAGKTANWTSNNPTIASVTPNGLVTGVGVGSTTVTAEIDNRTASLAIQVTLVPVGSVTMSPSPDTLVEGDVRQYNPVVRDTSGKVITSLLGRSVNFTSNNLPVASVTAQGVINGVSQGVATIVATIDGVASNDLTIRVARVAVVQVSPSGPTVAIGGTLQLTVVLKDAAGNILITSKPLSFNSGTPGVATVTQAGIVTGVSSGVAVITATINSVPGTTTVTVP